MSEPSICGAYNLVPDYIAYSVFVPEIVGSLPVDGGQCYGVEYWVQISGLDGYAGNYPSWNNPFQYKVQGKIKEIVLISNRATALVANNPDQFFKIQITRENLDKTTQIITINYAYPTVYWFLYGGGYPTILSYDLRLDGIYRVDGKSVTEDLNQCGTAKKKCIYPQKASTQGTIQRGFIGSRVAIEDFESIISPEQIQKGVRIVEYFPIVPENPLSPPLGVNFRVIGEWKSPIGCALYPRIDYICKKNCAGAGCPIGTCLKLFDSQTNKVCCIDSMGQVVAVVEPDCEDDFCRCSGNMG